MASFGLSFGKSKTKTSSDSLLTKNEATTGASSQNQNQSTTSTGTQNTQGSSTSQGTSNTSSTGGTTTQGTGTQQQEQKTNLFSDGILGGLEATIANLFDDSSGGAGASINAGLGQMGQFDVDKFIQSSLSAAQSNQDGQLDEAINGIFDLVGGKNNSMAALLGTKVQNQANANLAGVQADAAAKAQGIIQQGIGVAQGVAGQSRDFLANLLSTLKGGTQTVTGTTQTQTAEQQASQQAAQTATTEANQNQQQVQTQAMEQLTAMIQELMSQNVNTVATEKTTGTSSTKGGGASFGL